MSKTYQGLDERLLGQRLPGTPEERLEFLDVLEDLLDEHGEEWVRSSAKRLLWEADFIVNQ